MWGWFSAEAARASRDWGFKHLERDRLFSFIVPENLSSVRVAQKMGMTWWKAATFEGKEVSVYSITRREWNSLRVRSD